jgi:hypothetical protein
MAKGNLQSESYGIAGKPARMNLATEESHTLAALLPKLLSGELCVPS